MKISIVIPVFNEQENIKRIYQEILEYITPYEIIFVDVSPFSILIKLIIL